MESSDEMVAYEQGLARVTIGPLERMSGQVELVEYDPSWSQAFQREATRIRTALGRRALLVEHVGSTAVPDLPAKPIIDIVLEVADSSAELTYRPELEAVGYVPRIREPDWFNHRLFRDPGATINLHVFSSGCAETHRMVVFRDLLRVNAADRDRYAQAKLELAARRWTYMQQYADAKSDVIASILTRRQPPPRPQSEPR